MTAITVALPGRQEYGTDQFVYQDGRRMLVGATRTYRPEPGESGASFRERIDTLAQFLSTTEDCTIDVSEEIKAGVITQCVLTFRHAPQSINAIPEDKRTAGGRPAGPRGSRGGRRN